MKQIRSGSERFLYFDDGISVVRADVEVDTADELPAANVQTAGSLTYNHSMVLCLISMFSRPIMKEVEKNHELQI